MKHHYLITGATSALGLALVQRFQEQLDDSSKLFVVSRSHSEYLESIQNSNTQYRSGIDLATVSTESEFYSAIEDFFGEPFTLVHCAGDFWLHLPFEDFSTLEAKQMMDSHFLTLYNVLQGIIPIMKRLKGGNVLTFSCNATYQNLPNMVPFTAAKAAVDATIKCIAHEYAKDNIIANVLSLSSLKTGKIKESRPHADFDHFLELHDVADIVLDISSMSNRLMNGNLINCYEFSESYYNEGYFQRIARD